MDEEIAFTPEELQERREFIREQIKQRCSMTHFFYYKQMADDMEYAGISRKETFDTIHHLERTGELIRRRKRGQDK